jgi:hypothetical protein
VICSHHFFLHHKLELFFEKAREKMAVVLEAPMKTVAWWMESR